MFYGNATRLSFGPQRRAVLASLLILSLSIACFAVLLTPSSAHADEATADSPAAKAAEQMKKIKPQLLGSAVPSTNTLASSAIKGTLYCVGALLLGFALIKRFSPQENSGQNPISILARKSIGNKNSLILIEVFDQQFIVGAAGENLSLITKIEKSGSFSDALAEQFAEEAQPILKQVGA
ncbi:MAG: FliO/MopB family protein [Bdellovibrionales bacterium]|nr:FliO/MopB family protein [Bdellovibrionales bacterium]